MSVLQQQIAHYAEVRRRLNTPPQRKTAPILTVVVSPPVVAEIESKIDPAAASLFDEIAAMKAADIRRQSIVRIQMHVASFYNVSVPDIVYYRRTRAHVRPRHVAMYLSRKMTLRSLEDIGRYFGGRDHSTIHDAVKSITNMIETDAVLAAEIEQLRAELS